MDHGCGTEVWDVDGNRFLDFAAGIAVCALWLITIMNYKTLTDGKFQVICQLEQQLPSAPFRSEPGGPNLLPFTKVERSIPIVFAVLYAWVVLFHVAGA